MNVAWVPPQERLLDEDTARRVRNVIKGIPLAHLEPPVIGEMFQTPADALLRLQNWAFSQGFAIVSQSTTADRVRWHCIHHSRDTRNYRKLEDHVIRDADGHIISNRKRETTQNRLQRDCKWCVYLSLRGIFKGSAEKAWFLGITSSEHSHPMEENPLSYDIHVRNHPEQAPPPTKKQLWNKRRRLAQLASASSSPSSPSPSAVPSPCPICEDTSGYCSHAQVQAQSPSHQNSDTKRRRLLTSGSSSAFPTSSASFPDLNVVTSQQGYLTGILYPINTPLPNYQIQGPFSQQQPQHDRQQLSSYPPQPLQRQHHHQHQHHHQQQQQGVPTALSAAGPASLSQIVREHILSLTGTLPSTNTNAGTGPSTTSSTSGSTDRTSFIASEKLDRKLHLLLKRDIDSMKAVFCRTLTKEILKNGFLKTDEGKEIMQQTLKTILQENLMDIAANGDKEYINMLFELLKDTSEGENPR